MRSRAQNVIGESREDRARARMLSQKTCLWIAYHLLRTKERYVPAPSETPNGWFCGGNAVGMSGFLFPQFIYAVCRIDWTKNLIRFCFLFSHRGADALRCGMMQTRGFAPNPIVDFAIIRGRLNVYIVRYRRIPPTNIDGGERIGPRSPSGAVPE